MSKSKSYSKEISSSTSVLKDYIALVKFKLSMTVVMTSALGYLIAASTFVWSEMLFLIAGGSLVTFGANALNQVLEKDFDRFMQRTKDRPLAADRMKSSDAVLFAGMLCLVGVFLLSMLNGLASMLGMLSFVLYAFVYTPLKRTSTVAVAVGAIPGALPVLIGTVAQSGELTYLGLGLFVIQFLWQFPHFWSIGYLAFDDYKKAGYKLLPMDSEGQLDPKLSLHTVSYSILILLVVAMLGYGEVLTGMETLLIGLFSLGYTVMCVAFYNKVENSTALKVMFYSFFYMPAVLLTCLFL